MDPVTLLGEMEQSIANATAALARMELSTANPMRNLIASLIDALQHAHDALAATLGGRE